MLILVQKEIKSQLVSACIRYLPKRAFNQDGRFSSDAAKAYLEEIEQFEELSICKGVGGTLQQ